MLAAAIQPNTKIFVFAPNTLQGVASYLTMCWFWDRQNIPHETYHIAFFEDKFESFYKIHGNDYDFVVVISGGKIEDCRYLDKQNVVVIDNKEAEKEFKHATTMCVEYSSIPMLLNEICSLAYKTQLSKPRLSLIQLIDDYSNNIDPQLKAQCLEILYYYSVSASDLKQSNFFTFSKTFYNGICNKFSAEQKNILNFHFKIIQEKIENLELYEYISDGKKYIATYVDEYFNFIFSYIKKLLDPDIILIAHLDKNRVFFRNASGDPNINVYKLAELICNKPIGYSYAASGFINEDFMQFINEFSKVDIK